MAAAGLMQMWHTKPVQPPPPSEQEIRAAEEAIVNKTCQWAGGAEADAFRKRAFDVAQHVEKEGGGDTATKEWLGLRKYRITGTRAPCVLGLGYDSSTQLLKKLDVPMPSFVRRLCQWGTENEKNAVAAFEEVRVTNSFGEEWGSGADVTFPGLLLREEWPWASGSPDGMLASRLTGRRAMLEFKCPGAKAKKHMTIEEVKEKGVIYDIKSSKAEAGMSSAVPQQYFSQCQWNAGMGDCDEIFFAVWVQARVSEVAPVEKLGERELAGCKNTTWTTKWGTLHIVEIHADRIWFAAAVTKCYVFWQEKFLRHCALLLLGYLLPGELESDKRGKDFRPPKRKPVKPQRLELEEQSNSHSHPVTVSHPESEEERAHPNNNNKRVAPTLRLPLVVPLVVSEEIALALGLV